MALLFNKKIIVLAEYLDFADVFLEKLANIFPEQTGVNKHTIR